MSRRHEKPVIDDFLSTVLGLQFVSFLPRRIEDSAAVIWVYLYTQCDFVKTFFQRTSNVSNSETIGLFVPNEQKFSEKGFVIQFSRY